MSARADVAVVGAGLAGRLTALALQRAGHKACVFEAGPAHDPALPGQVRSDAASSASADQLRAAAWTAAGMLSPIAEMETGGAMIRDLGLRSLILWNEIDDLLRESQTPSAAASPLGLHLNDSLMVCHAQDMGAAQRVLRLLDNDPQQLIELSADEIRPMAPELKGRLYAWRLKGEGHLHPPTAMQALHQACGQVQWNFHSRVTELTARQLVVNGNTESFDWVVDTRGLGAAGDIAVRGVRGEVIVLSAPGFLLERSVRLLHPRWRVYIVPRPNHQILIGATEIESEDRSPISVQSTLELLNAAFSIFPSLAEARVLYTDVNLRPATPDNLPLIQTQPGLTRINGLFRHGWLLAPAVVEKALRDAELH